jgi:hypothetical protein
MLAYFAVRAIYFFSIRIVPSRPCDLQGLSGFSVAVNGGMRQPAPAKAPAPNPAYLPFRLPRVASA